MILTPVVYSVAPGSNLHTETGYPDFGVSVVVYWICRKIPRFILIRPWPHPDTFLYTNHIFKINVVPVPYNILIVCLFSWRYNPLWLYFHSPVADFSLLVFEVS